MKFLSIIWLYLLHPFYVSVTTIDQNKEQNALQITSRIFYDDLEAALKDKFGTKIDLKNNSQKEKNTQLIKKYFEHHFSIKINNSVVPFEFLGFGIEEEAAWCYLEIKTPKIVQKVELNSSMLYNSFKDQINIFHLNINKQKKSQKIANPQTKINFDFNSP